MNSRVCIWKEKGKGVRDMKRHKKGITGYFFLTGCLMAVLLTGCGGQTEGEITQTQAAGQGTEYAQHENGNMIESVELTEDFSMPEKKINHTRFSDLPLAAEKAGFAFYALQEFSNGYKFSNFSEAERELEDGAGEKTGEKVNQVKMRYLHPNGLWTVDITAYPLDKEPEHTVLYEWTKEIEGVQVSLNTYIMRLVLNDYVMTEEDRALEETGKYTFSCDGISEGDCYFYMLYFIKDGIYYEFYGALEGAGCTTLTIEEYEAMVADFLQHATLQGE